MKHVLYGGLAALLLAVTACADNDTSKATAPHAVTFDEATLLAGALNANAQAGTADFVAGYQPVTGTPFKLEGTVHWLDLAGEGTAYVAASVAQFAWTETLVTITEDGATTEHTPDPGTNPIDYTIAAIMGMASKQSDNPSLVQQSGATVTTSDEHTTTFLIGTDPNSPLITVDNDTGTVTHAIITLDGGGHLTITFTIPEAGK